MKKRLKSLVLSTTLALSLVTNSFAADPANMTDISGHWAEPYISWVLENGLYNGTSDITFAPDDTMTRGMFVKVLGSLAGIDPDEYRDSYLDSLYTDVSANAWYAPYVNWATRYGITNGTGDGEFKPDAPVTREQIATLLRRYASIYNYNITTVPDALIAEAFADADEVSDFASDAVECMRITGVFTGKPAGDGTYYFDPLAEATRAECATVFCRIAGVLEYNEENAPVEPTGLSLNMTEVTLKPGDTTALGATVIPEHVSNATVTWVSSDPSVAKVGITGQVTAVSEGTAEIICYTWNGITEICTVTCEKETSLASDSESYNDKCMRIFGEVLPRYSGNWSPYSYYYSSAAEAAANMETISVRVWDFADSTRTTKVTKTRYLQVHKNIADTVVAIFEEIYNGDEQFPIKNVGGYRWEPGSEHGCGLAIDINWEENYYYNSRTGQTVGNYWKPGEDPYSIPLDGDVANAFKKYGFSQGIWTYTVDYMHFSYFGT